MFARQMGVRAVQALAFAGVVASLSGCAAKVKREDYNNDMARLREEIAASDRQLGVRVDSTSQAVADHSRRLNALDQEFQAFRSEFKVSIEKMQGLLKFAMPVHFEFDRADVRDADKPVLDRFVTVVKEYYPGAIITVEGFTDPAGSAAYNKQLGMRRAEAVRDYLTSNGGFDNSHLKAVSYGESQERQAVAGAAGPGDRGMENRRVVIVIDHEAIATDQVAAR
jgi:peptidoglycan-associated lipoprotein